MIIINASPTEVTFGTPSLRGRTLQIHPIQVNHFSSLNVVCSLQFTFFFRSCLRWDLEGLMHGTLRHIDVFFLYAQLMGTDETVKSSKYEASAGCFNIPPRTTSVFVEPREI